MRNAHVIYIIL